MRNERFEDIYPPSLWRMEALQVPMELARRVYDLAKHEKCARGFGMKGYIQDGATPEP